MPAGTIIAESSFFVLAYAWSDDQGKGGRKQMKKTDEHCCQSCSLPNKRRSCGTRKADSMESERRQQSEQAYWKKKYDHFDSRLLFRGGYTRYTWL
ncbi:hypothetical protein DNH61_12155 [Paenibacillus sambharensis]|uniref:Uncharacterized protein n=1 Tax=Paenibacillus sambharensis TaxID=1803190 RepID=A0A2W1L959_9BACL|nr:hypothetical protein [Paenibacillus sambharensis]PZD95299.1 hypothetical protein DNH61_12155 [Paenibacillus sambharensis]